tara:strand:- start:3408 stop:4283 length:876 start_codon:yes stop_codon:yes gene_type:complete
MKYVKIFLYTILPLNCLAQTTTFDNLNANYLANKSITWYTSDYGNGFGHRIINADPGGQTLLNFEGRHNNASWSTIMSLTSNGKVGIGTINPSQSLEVNSSSSTHAVFKGNFTGIQGIKVERSNGDNIRLVANYMGFGSGLEASSALRFSVNGNDLTSPSFYIKTNGKVGIGTTNPDMKLTVKGNIHAEEVKVDLSVPAPDYVFKEDYKLKTLEETQKYINENGHLPNIPSAKEFEENGVALGIMNMKLLEKIEELTLYVIKQEKHIEAQSKEIDMLKSLEIRIKKLELIK